MAEGKSSSTLQIIPLKTQEDQCKLDGTQLVQIIELSRHGSRAPYYDLFDFRTNWKLPLKTLTPIGMRQHYLIGKEIFRRYSDSIFNNGEIKMDSISVYCTSQERTSHSALSQLSGILESSKGWKVHDNWQYQQDTDLPPMAVFQGEQLIQRLDGLNLPNGYLPILVKVPDNRRILEPSDSINGYGRMKALNFTTEIYNKFEESLTEYKKEFIEKFELKDTKVSDITVKVIADHWDSVICDIYEQIPLPENFDKKFVQMLKFVYDFQQLYINYNGSNGDLLKVQTTALFNDILDVIQNQAQTKFKYYSASDVNLNALLVALGYSTYTTDFEEWLNPTTGPSHTNTPFSSTIIFEVYHNPQSNKKFIRILYNDKPVHIQGSLHSVYELEYEFIPALNEHGILPEDLYNIACE